MAAVDGGAGDPARSGPGPRADVQALRAVAVAGVVVYHLWPHALGGGFVGVDVFFVISGFLITGQLVDELQRTGRIALVAFWARRIRRLLPAALVVLAVSLVVTIVVLPPIAHHDNAEQVRAAALYFENWHLAARSADQVAVDPFPTLVQHYWSLSVEEQFYVVWPVLLLLAAPLASVLPPRRPCTAILTVLGAAALASFVLCLYQTAVAPDAAFYATPVRAWEFALGGLVASVPPRLRVRRSPALAVALAAAGAATIVTSYVAVSRSEEFPGAVALLPVVGTVAVLAGGTTLADARTTGLMGGRPVQWLGDHSYAVYLWHWPLIMVARWTVLAVAPQLVRAAVIVATLLLAAATARWIENPVRHGRWWTRGRLPAYSLALVGAGGLAVLAASLGRLVVGSPGA